MVQKYETKEQDILKDLYNYGTVNPIKSSSKTLSYYSTSKYDRSEIFDKYYAMGLELMSGDKLLKPVSAINSVQIRKTTTLGLYKLVLNNPQFTKKIRYIDEAQLLYNREYCQGSVSLVDIGKYELTYFDDDDEIIIENYSKEEVIRFMDKNRLIFQL